MKTTIEFPRETWLVRVVDPEAVCFVDQAGSAQEEVVALERQFFLCWADLANRARAAQAPRSSRDRVIIRRLLAKWGLDKLKTYANIFWLRHSRAKGIFDGRHLDQIVIFAATVPEIVADQEKGSGMGHD